MSTRYILPPDLVRVRIGDSERIRSLLPDASPDDWLITRPHSRQPSRIVAGDAAALVLHFTAPCSIIDAVVAFARARNADPHGVLEEAYPLVRDLVSAGLLAPEGAPQASPIRDTSHRSGRSVAGFRLGRRVQALADVEVFQAWTREGNAVALKLARNNSPGTAAQLAHEASILACLDDELAPRLARSGVHRGRAYLAVAWCDGAPIDRVAAELRRAQDWEGLHGLAVHTAGVFARLHAQRILHGDVHPRNILVDGGRAIHLIDFGLSRRLGASGPDNSRRGGLGPFFEPEYARAVLAGAPPPPVTAAGEQYSLAVLLFGLLTGREYLQLPLERDPAFRKIADAPPLSFAACGAAAWPEMERVLERALAKSPEDRFPSLAAFARALESVSARRAGPRRRSTALASRPLAGRLIRATVKRLTAEVRSDLGATPPPAASIYSGAAGIAYGVLRLAQIRDDGHLLALSQLWRMRAENLAPRPGAFRSAEAVGAARRAHRASIFHGRCGVLLTAALEAQVSGRAYDVHQACRRFVAEAASPAAPTRELDLTLGRAGVLIACALLHDSLGIGPPGCDSDGAVGREVDRLGDRVASELWGRCAAAAPGDPGGPLRLSGVAHGWSGLFYGLLVWHDLRGTRPPGPLRDKLDRLARLAEPAGRGVVWPVRLSRSGGGAAMASWCNGAPGQTHLWIRASRVYREPAYLRLAERSAWNAWEAEAGNGSLCCGEAGRAYAAVALWRETGENVWLERARVLTERAAHQIGNPDRIDSLYKGPLGVALALSDADRPEGAAFPFFELPS